MLLFLWKDRLKKYSLYEEDKEILSTSVLQKKEETKDFDVLSIVRYDATKLVDISLGHKKPTLH